eukprot:2923324-Prymnesium_polylepis.1
MPWRSSKARQPLCQRARDALAVEVAGGARASAAGRAGVEAGVPSGVHPRHLPERPGGSARPCGGGRRTSKWMIGRTSTARCSAPW